VDLWPGHRGLAQSLRNLHGDRQGDLSSSLTRPESIPSLEAIKPRVFNPLHGSEQETVQAKALGEWANPQIFEMEALTTSSHLLVSQKTLDLLVERETSVLRCNPEPTSVSLPRITPANMIASGMLRAITEKEGWLTSNHIISRILSLQKTKPPIMGGFNLV